MSWLQLCREKRMISGEAGLAREEFQPLPWARQYSRIGRCFLRPCSGPERRAERASEPLAMLPTVPQNGNQPEPE